MTSIELNDNAETLLQRILDKRFLPGIKSITMRESMVEYLIIEEARRLKVMDCSQSEDRSHPQGSVLEDQDLEADE